MSRHDRIACLLFGLVVLAGFLPVGAPAGSDPPGGVPLPPPLPAPQWIGGTDARGKAQLTWIRNPVFAAVRVYRREEGLTAAFSPVSETKENGWLDDTVQAGRTYRYRLVGVGPDGREGRQSAELMVRIGSVRLRPPATPEWEGFLPTGDGVNLRWNAREGEDVIAWNIYRKVPPETVFRLIGSVRGTSYLDEGLVTDRLYVYVLTALDSNFQETPYSQELPVKLVRPQALTEPQRVAARWRVRRTRLVALIGGGGNLSFERPADVVVGPLSGSVYVADSGRNMVFVFSPQGDYQRFLGAGLDGKGGFKNVLGLATDREENLYVVDAGNSEVRRYSPQGRPGRSVDLPRRPAGGATGLIDAAIGSDGRIFVVDNYNNEIAIVEGKEGAQTLGQSGANAGQFSAPTFCAVDAAGNFYVADCLNARVQVFSGSGEFQRAFGRSDRSPGGFGRPKGIAISAAGEVYVADSWMNTIQVFDAQGKFLAILGDESGQPLDLGSPNGVALGPGGRVYVAERLAARLQIRELIDAP